jgi:hypothetical protein
MAMLLDFPGDLESKVKLPCFCHRFGDALERPRTTPCVFNFLGGLEGELEGLVSLFRLPRFCHRSSDFNFLCDLKGAVKLPRFRQRFNNVPERFRTILFVLNFLNNLKGLVKLSRLS